MSKKKKLKDFLKKAGMAAAGANEAARCFKK